MIKVGRQPDCRGKCRRTKATLILSDPIIYWYSQNQTVVGITHITAPAPLASQPQAKLYPSLPTRRHSYSNSPDSAIVSTRPSFSSTLPCPNSRSRGSPYEVSEHKSDQMSTPIELRDIQPDLGQDVIDGDSVDLCGDNIDVYQAEPELDNNYDEDNISFVNHSLSQQPLLNMSSFQGSQV